jgi:transcriptional regulator with XRE-family HTH domain
VKKMDLSSVEFGKRLRELRIAAHLTVREIAEAMEISPATYREWERGRAITGQPYLKLAQVLRVSLPGLFGIDHGDKQHLLHLVECAQKALEDLKGSL